MIDIIKEFLKRNEPHLVIQDNGNNQAALQLLGFEHVDKFWVMTREKARAAVKRFDFNFEEWKNVYMLRRRGLKITLKEIWDGAAEDTGV